MPRPTNMKTKTRFGVLICNQLSKMGKILFDKKRKTGIIHHARQRPAQRPAVKLRFTTLYTFPPLYTQKPAARRVFVFVGAFFFFTKGSGGKPRT